MSIYGHKGPEDELPEHWRLQEQRISHRQGRLVGGDVKRLYEAASHILAVYADNDLCVCDGGDHSVGMGPVTCEAHMLALLVEDIINSQRPTKAPRSGSTA